jgi:tRNA A-37 threonylcarbamoyl transferase component Bud32
MSNLISTPINELEYKGEISSQYFSDGLVKQLTSLKQILSSEDSIKLSDGKDYVVKCKLELTTGHRWVAIKVFSPQPFWKDIYDKKNKSKAERSYIAAKHLTLHKIGTPTPLAWIEKWKERKLVESYYICIYEPGICVRDLISDILWNKRNSEPLMQLIELLAPAVRRMHDVGFMHGDMGNQNILLPKDNQGNFLDPQWIDLNRSRTFNRPLTAKERAFDLSRLVMPSGYFQWFKFIYSNHQTVDPELEKHEEFYRKSFTRHRRNSKFRHPLRYLKQKRQNNKPVYPHEKNVWLWDEKSGQPMITMTKKNKNQHREWRFFLGSIWKTLTALPGIWSEYKKLQDTSFQRPIELKNRIGVALHPKTNYLHHELPLHQQLGQPPVMIRFYHHETADDWQNSIELVQQLKSQSVEIMVAMIQDRQAVTNPESWRAFLTKVIPAIADAVSHIEITHAYNRVKWGIWNHQELIQLMQPAFELQQQYPQIKLTGPACIDFEYAPVISALKSMPKQFHFSALSHLLYVDRRGAPENRQGKFSTLEKVTLLKALANKSDCCDNKVIISEVNWPVKHTGVWSPVICPYITPKWRKLEPGETEDVYAHYMLRYLMICLCSGHAEQVFWWRVSAHGYGLTDDQDNFRQRPAFIALQFLLSLLGDASFEKKWQNGQDQWILEFSKGNKRYLMAWTNNNQIAAFGQAYKQAWDYLGKEIDQVELSGAPIYILLHD